MKYRDDYARDAREAMSAVWVLIIINIVVYILGRVGLGENGRLYLTEKNRFEADCELELLSDEL